MMNRIHDERAFQYTLHGFEIKGTSSDFIDHEMEDLMDNISEKHYNDRETQSNLMKQNMEAMKNAT